MMDKESAKQLIELFDDESDDLEIVEDGDWTQDHKYQNREVVCKYTDGKYYCFCESRSGSYFSDWEYGDTVVYEVKPVTKTIVVTDYVVVK